MNIELRLLLWLARHLPRVRGSGRLGHHLAEFYRRKKRSSVVCDVLGFRMRLDPMEFVDGDILFVPQICERRERRLLERALNQDTFSSTSAATQASIHSLHRGWLEVPGECMRLMPTNIAYRA